MVNLVIWNEFVHEQEDEHVKSIYPKGIHGCIKDFLSKEPVDSSFSNNACLTIKSSIVLSGIIYFFSNSEAFFSTSLTIFSIMSLDKTFSDCTPDK